MTNEEMSNFELLAGRIVSGFASIPPNILRDYIQYSAQVKAGEFDAQFMKVITITNIKQVKMKVEFLATVAQLFLDTRPLIEKYLIDSGQMVKENNNASNDNIGTIR